MISKTYTKSATTVKSKQLLDQLVYPMVKRTYDKVPSNQSYQQAKPAAPDSNSKRIRTEGNDQNNLESASSISPPKFGTSEYVMEERITAKSHSPISGQPINLLIKNLLAHSKKRQPLIKKPIPRETRNQSADFQMLLKPSQTAQSPPTQKKKPQSQGNLNDHIYFTQRGGLESKLTYPKLHDYYRSILSKRSPAQQSTSSLYKLYPRRTNTTPPVQYKLTLAQIKEQLNQIRSKMGSGQKTQAKRKQSCEQNQPPPTQKKQQQLNFEDSGKRIRTENSQYSNLESRQSFRRDDPEPESYQLRFYEPDAPKKSLEEKIDLMWQEITKLKQRSEQLEEQNQLLFQNLSKIQKEKDNSSDERVHLLMKLDHMIDMQRRQEENLAFFKTIFQNPSMAESLLKRRIKTDSVMPTSIKQPSITVRHHAVQSEHNQ